MAEEGATFYYVSKQDFDFEKSYSYLKRAGLSLRDSDTNLITVQKSDGEYIGEKIENIKDIIYKDKSSGTNLYLDSGHRTFWSFSETNNCFLENFTFNYIGNLEIEERLCKIFINLAIKIITEIGTQFLGFTLDMYGETENYEFAKIFDDTNIDTLNNSYISDLTIIPKNQMSQFTLDKKIEVIEVSRNFDCIAKNEIFAKYLKTLLSIN